MTYELEEKSSDNVNVVSVGYSGGYGVTGALGFTINNFSLANPLEGGAGTDFGFTGSSARRRRTAPSRSASRNRGCTGTPTTLGVTCSTRGKVQHTTSNNRLSARFARGHLKWT